MDRRPRRATILVAALVAAAMQVSAQDASCPSTAAEVAFLNPLSACIVTPYVALPIEEAKARVASGEVAKCVAENNACVNAVKYNDCQKTTSSLMQVLVPASIQTAELLQCPNFFKGFPEFCDQPFGSLVGKYCPDPPLLPLVAVLGVVAGGLFLCILSIFVCWRTRKSILLDREIEEAVAFNKPIKNAISPPSQNQSNPVVLKSDFVGVEWNQTAGGWDAIYKTKHVREWLGTFATQDQAAKRYDQKVIQVMNNGGQPMPLNFPPEGSPSQLSSATYSPGTSAYPSPGFQAPAYAQDSYPQEDQVSPLAPPPGLGSTYDPFDPDRERHIAELIEFYRFHDPDRTDHEAHVRALFNKYRFKGIARAVLRKYGVLPPGWAGEYDATRSIAMSVATKFFSPSNSGMESATVTYAQGDPERDPVPHF